MFRTVLESPPSAHVRPDDGHSRLTLAKRYHFYKHKYTRHIIHISDLMMDTVTLEQWLKK